MRGYRVDCFLPDGSTKTVTLKATSDTEAISEARIVPFSQNAFHYQVMSSTKKGRKVVYTVIFDSRKRPDA